MSRYALCVGDGARKRGVRAAFAAATALLAACSNEPAELPTASGAATLAATFQATPIVDMAPGETYQGLEGGLFDHGSNVAPAEHDSAGVASAAAVAPRDGKIVVLAIGFSTVYDQWRQFQTEFAGVRDRRGRYRLRGLTWTAERDEIVLVNGAQGGADASYWDDPEDSAYDIVSQRLGPYAESDVQVVWLQVVNKVNAEVDAPPTLPAADADAWSVADACSDIVDALAVRYPNLRQVFVSAKQYTGYSEEGKAAEPYSFESGFGARRCVLDRNGRTDPFVGHGPYMWDPTWPRNWYKSDGVHLHGRGTTASAALLAKFFETSPYTEWWR